MSKKKDVVIIGAGVIGSSIAYHLAKKGIPSQIIERESIGARASGKAWGVLSYPPLRLVRTRDPNDFYAMPEGESYAHWIDIYQSGFHRIADIALDVKERGDIDIEYGDVPLTMAAASEGVEAAYKGFVSYLREQEIYECEWLESEDLRAIFPGISPSVRGGVTVPQLQVEPYKYTLGLAQAAEAMGAEVRHGDVVGFETKGERITSVKLASGAKIETDIVVIAMGPWTKLATSWLGNEIPLHIAMEECLCLEPPKDYPLHSISIAGGESSIFVEFVSKVNGQLIVAEAEVQSASHYWELKTRHDFDDSLTEIVKTKNLAAAIEFNPDLEEANLLEHRGDLLAYGPAPYYHRPIMGRLPEWKNGYVATGFGGLGIDMSPGAGEAMADLIADGQAPFRARHMMEHLSPAGLRRGQERE